MAPTPQPIDRNILPGVAGQELMTPGEVAKLFRVDPKTVTRWAASGRLESIRTPGGQHRYRREHIEAVLRAGVQRPATS